MTESPPALYHNGPPEKDLCLEDLTSGARHAAPAANWRTSVSKRWWIPAALLLFLFVPFLSCKKSEGKLIS